MKKLLGVAVLMIVTCCAFAQDSSANMKDNSMMPGKQMKKDCMMMKDSKMIVMKNGMSMSMDSTMTLKNGTMVMTDGTVKMADGTTKKLKEGQSIDADGKITMMKNKSM